MHVVVVVVVVGVRGAVLQNRERMHGRSRARGARRGEEQTGSLSPSARSIRIINNPRRVWNGTRNRNISPVAGELRRQINYYRRRQVLSRLPRGGGGGAPWCTAGPPRRGGGSVPRRGYL
jgi:hypothetical protein